MLGDAQLPLPFAPTLGTFALKTVTPSASVAFFVAHSGCHVPVLRVNAINVSFVPGPLDMNATMSGKPSPSRSPTATAADERNQSTLPSPSRSTPPSTASCVQSVPFRMRRTPRCSV